MKKFVVIGIIILIVIVSIFIVDNIRKNNSQEILRIGIAQPVDHNVFEEFKKGVIEGFKEKGYEEGKNIEFDFQNSKGDTSVLQSIANKFSADHYDILIPMGTQPTQLIANKENEKPIIFCGVPDPVGAGVMDNTEKPTKNITGTSDMVFYEKNIDILMEFKSETKKIGIILNEGEVNSTLALERIKKYTAENYSVEIVTMNVTNTNEVMQVAEILAPTVDAMFMINDNTVLSAQENLIQAAEKNNIPLIAIDETGVEKGALAYIGTSYKMVGVHTAEMCIKYLNNKSIEELPVKVIDDANIYINQKTVNELNFKMPNTEKYNSVKILEN